jgi:tight adherence protein C
VIAAIVLGCGFGLGAAAFLYALAPSPPRLDRALAALHRPVRAEESDTTMSSSLPLRMARRVGLSRIVNEKARSDLAVTEHDETWHLTWCVTLGLVGLSSGVVIEAVGLLSGAALPWALPVCFSLVAGPVGILSQVLSLRTEAAKRRSDFSFALSAWLDLVVVSMAAGRGTEGALVLASEQGSGFAFGAIRRTLEGARLRGIAPWDGLDELGQRLGVEELCGIASSVRLAGASGAKVRRSLAARAKALRERGLTEARAASESQTERMSVPVVLLVLGFIVLIGWPAVVQITTQL